MNWFKVGNKGRRYSIAMGTVLTVSIFRLWTESVSIEIGILKLLIDNNWALVPYLIISAITLIFIKFFIPKYEENSIFYPLRIVLPFALIAITIVCLTVGSYPPIDVAMDHDEATEAWIDAFLENEYPYDPASHEDFSVSELTVLPSIPLISLPFYLVGDIAILSVFAVGTIVFILEQNALTNSDYELAIFGLLLSIPLYFRLLGHSNYVELISIFLLALHFLWERQPIIAGVVIGVLFAGKTNVWPLLPVVAVSVFNSWETQETIKFLLASGFTGLGILIPFLLWEPDIFINVAPLGVASSHVSFGPLGAYGFALLVVFISISAYIATRQLTVGLIMGTIFLLLEFPGRYQLFLIVFIIAWAFLDDNLESM